VVQESFGTPRQPPSSFFSQLSKAIVPLGWVVRFPPPKPKKKQEGERSQGGVGRGMHTKGGLPSVVETSSPAFGKPADNLPLPPHPYGFSGGKNSDMLLPSLPKWGPPNEASFSPRLSKWAEFLLIRGQPLGKPSVGDRAKSPEVGGFCPEPRFSSKRHGMFLRKCFKKKILGQRISREKTPICGLS